MARIDQLLSDGRTYSFEFFPPKNPAGEEVLAQALRELEPLRPSFVSVTYGAGGSTRERTHDLVVQILRQTVMPPMAHLTCAAHTKAELADILRRYRDAGVENVLALGGDPPLDSDLPPGDFRNALELVDLAHEVGGFSIGVAAHPELHPRSADREEDRRHLAVKLARADFAITQFFFSAHHYIRMVDELDRLGVRKPVVPGIMPVTSLSQIQRMSQMSGAEFPDELCERFQGLDDQPEKVRAIGVEQATQLCQDLLEAGAPGLHFYTLNRSTATREIYANLGLPEAA